MNQYFVYILKCSDNSYYTGVTNDLERRFEEHQTGINKKSYTHNRRPVTLAFYTDFNDINQAIAFEKQVKGWNRKKKEALINDEWEKLPSLAECKNQTSHTRFDSARRDKNEQNQKQNVGMRGVDDTLSGNKESSINIIAPFDSAQEDNNDSTKEDNNNSAQRNVTLSGVEYKWSGNETNNKTAVPFDSAQGDN